MRTIFTLALLSVFAFLAKTQNINENNNFINHRKLLKRLDLPNASVTSFTFDQSKSQFIRKTKSSYMTQISSSCNAYTLADAEARCLSYNQDANLLMFCHRGNPIAGIGLNTGSIINSISTDGGMNWKDLVVTKDTTKHNRYPSGVIFNFSGNSNYKNAYSVFSGPVTNDINWNANYFGSAKFDSSHFDYQYYPKSSSNQQDYPYLGMTVGSDSIAHVLGFKNDTNKSGLETGLTVFINNGKFDSTTNKFNWTNSKIKHPFYKTTNGAIQELSFNMAWSSNGKIGYVFFIGIDSANNYKTFQPIVYKSIDKGNTWHLLPIYNFRNLHDITKYIGPLRADTSLRKPMFNYESYNGAVDANGNLHFARLERG